MRLKARPDLSQRPQTASAIAGPAAPHGAKRLALCILRLIAPRVPFNLQQLSNRDERAPSEHNQTNRKKIGRPARHCALAWDHHDRD
jgi:hypothetical protein